jgi:DNA-binding PadR family transcriptional regulator
MIGLGVNLTRHPCVMHICVTQCLQHMDRERRSIDDRLPLRPVEFHILLSLAAGERHGYGILLDIQERGDAPVPDVGTMYRALARMAEEGLIEAAARRPAPDASDERRNYYQITEAGRRVAIAEARRLEALTRAARLGGLLSKLSKAAKS